MCVKVYAFACICVRECALLCSCVCIHACMRVPFHSDSHPLFSSFLKSVARGEEHLPVFFPSSISDKTIEVVEVFGYTQKQSEEWDILKPPLSRPQGRCNSPGVNNVKKQHIFFVSGVRLGSKRASAFCLKLIIWPEPQALGPLCKLLSF